MSNNSVSNETRHGKLPKETDRDRAIKGGTLSYAKTKNHAHERRDFLVTITWGMVKYGLIVKYIPFGNAIFEN